jgi:hypothetical protein
MTDTNIVKFNATLPAYKQFIAAMAQLPDVRALIKQSKQMEHATVATENGGLQLARSQGERRALHDLRELVGLQDWRLRLEGDWERRGGRLRKPDDMQKFIDPAEQIARAHR